MDYLPLDRGWRRCWVCGRRWGTAGSADPGDLPDLTHLQLLLGLGDPTTAPASKRPARVKPGEQHPELRVRRVETADELELALADVLAAERPLVALDPETYGEAARADWRLRDRPGSIPSRPPSGWPPSAPRIAISSTWSTWPGWVTHAGSSLSSTMRCWSVTT
jgi:hypothetical protein